MQTLQCVPSSATKQEDCAFDTIQSLSPPLHLFLLVKSTRWKAKERMENTRCEPACLAPFVLLGERRRLEVFQAPQVCTGVTLITTTLAA